MLTSTYHSFTRSFIAIKGALLVTTFSESILKHKTEHGNWYVSSNDTTKESHAIQRDDTVLVQLSPGQVASLVHHAVVRDDDDEESLVTR